MTLTFKKRQKEMKRMEKQRAKAERRLQKKLDKRAGIEIPTDPITGEPIIIDEGVAGGEPVTSGDAVAGEKVASGPVTGGGAVAGGDSASGDKATSDSMTSDKVTDAAKSVPPSTSST